MASNHLDKLPIKLHRRMLRALATGESQPSPTALLQWDDIDDSQTLDLGGEGGTSLVFTKNSDLGPGPNYFTLRSYDRVEFTPERRRLIELASADENLFLSVRCIFDQNRKVYVGIELSDISLADIIDCTIGMDEIHLSAILGQVSRALDHLHTSRADSGAPLTYGNLEASNVFIQRDGTVKLAPFGIKVRPEVFTEENRHKDRWGLGALAVRIISGRSNESDSLVPQPKMIPIPSAGRSVYVSAERSPELIDLLGLCFSKQAGVGNILKHPFLRLGSPGTLSRLVLNAERKAWRDCIPRPGRDSTHK